MRTTLNLDDDVSSLLAEAARTRGTSLSRVANDWLRFGMAARRNEPRARYLPTIYDTGAPKLDVTDIGAVLGELDS